MSVMSSATSSSAQSNDRVPEFCNAPLSTEPDEEMVSASVMKLSEIVEVADTTPAIAWSGPVRVPSVVSPDT